MRRLGAILGVVSLAVTGVAIAPAQAAVTPPASFELQGSGFGHGVGMSQYGAKALAAGGRTAAEIVAHYYSGSSVLAVRDDMDIRVNLLHAVASVSLKGLPLETGGGKLHVGVDGTWGVVGAATDIWSVAPSGGSIVVTRNGQPVRTGAIATFLWGGTRYPGSTGDIPSLISVNGTTYRHGFVTVQAVAGKLEVVLRVRLGDEYLAGLAEMPSSWPTAALQAQVIAARSFAVLKYAAGLRSACACHVYDGTSDQVYAGWAKQSSAYGSAWTAAVAATSTGSTTGLAVGYGGKPVSAYYFSSSGGRTQNSEDVWSAALPYARSVADPGATESTNPYRSWTRAISQGSLAAAFGLPDVVRLDLSARTAAGGVRTATAWSAGGTARSITGEQLRSRLGLPSTWVRRAVDRLAGSDRYATAAAIAREVPVSGDAVVIASGEDGHLVDGMVSAPLATSLAAPILLTSGTLLPSASRAEIQRRAARTAYIVGGPAAVGPEIEAALTAAGVTRVRRVAGPDRYGTAAAVARAMGVPAGTPVLVAGGAAEAEALVAGAAGAAAGRPVLLVGQQMPRATADLLAELQPAAATIVGSTATVPAEAVASLPKAWRAAGADRYAVAAEVARAFAPVVRPGTVVLASGLDRHRVDALAGGALGRLVLLTPGTELPAGARIWLQSQPSVRTVTAAGGTAPVSAAALAEARDA